MKTKFYYLIILFLLSVSVYEKANAQAPAWLCAKGFGDTDLDEGYDITTDSFGNVYTIGNFAGTVDFDPGPGVYNLISTSSTDIFISKLSSTGNLTWVKQLKGGGQKVGKAIALDAGGNIYITGSFEGTTDFDPDTLATFNLSAGPIREIFVLKLNAAGNFVWAKQMVGTGNANPNAIAVDGNGNIYTTGAFAFTVDFDPGAGTFNLVSLGTSGNRNMFVSKLDSSGNFVWAKAFTGLNVSDAFSVAVDNNGNVYTTGCLYGTYDFDPDTTIVYNMSSIGWVDIFISKLNSAGNFEWAHSIGSNSGSNHARSIITDAPGNIYLTGDYSNTVDFDLGAGVFNLTAASGNGSPNTFIAKYDPSGSLILAKGIGSIAGVVAGKDIAIDASHNIYTTGFYNDTADFNPGIGIYNLASVANEDDIFIFKLDSVGNFAWAKSGGGARDDYPNAIACDNLGNLNVTGRFKSDTISFDAFNALSEDAATPYGDIFIAKLSGCATAATINAITCNSYTSPSGNYVWTTAGTYFDTIPNAAGCDSLLTVNLAIHCPEPAPAWQWAKATGAKGDDGGVAIGVDGLGNVYTTGHFTDTVDFDPGPGIFNLNDPDGMFIYKSDSSGNFIWAKAITEASPYALAVDQSGNVIITGDYTGTVDFDPGAGVFNLPTTALGDGDAFILKLDSSGNFLWAKSVNSADYDRGMAVTIDASGFIYTAGGYNLHQSYINKLNTSGSIIWSRIFSGTAADVIIYSIAVDGSGNAFTAGYFVGTADFDSGAGTFNLTASSIDIFISKLDNAGNFVWAKSMQGTPGGLGIGQSIAIDASGNVYTSGFFFDTTDFDPGPATFNLTTGPGNYDIFISKLNSSGNFVWAKSMGGPVDDQVFSLAMDTSKNIYLTGSFGATVDFDPDSGVNNLTAAGAYDIFISKFNDAGSFTWCKGFGGTGYEHAHSICLGPSDMVHITGSFQSPYLVAGTDTLMHDADTLQANNDLLIAKLSLTCSTWSVINVTACNSYTSPSGNYNWTNPGTYIDTIPNASGCDSLITINLTINPLPVALYTLYPDTATPHNWFALNQCTGTPPLSYVWNWGDSSAVSTGATPTHLYADSGYYNICVEVTDGNGCSSTYCDSSTYIYKGNSNSMVTLSVVTQLPTGIENIDGTSLVTFYPNPATNHLTISLPKISQKVNVVISDITGKAIYNITDASTQKLEVNTKDFSYGVYFVRIQTSDFVETKELIIQK